MKKQGTMDNGQLTRDNGELPKGWEMKKLGEIGKVCMCKRILKKQTSQTGDIPFYKIGTFGKKANAFISKDVYEEYRSKYSFPKKGDILISASGTIGRRVIYDGKPAYFQDSNIVWIDNDEKFVTNEYLYKFYGYCDWNPSKGATISRLYNDDLRAILIPIPPLPEQKRIVAILDRAFKAIDQAKAIAEQNLNNAKELFESYLNQIFEKKGDDWEEKNLGDVCKTSAGGTPLKTHKDYYENGNIPWLRSGEVCQKYIDKTELFITEKGLINSSAKVFPKNTVLVAMYGATAGQVGILKIESTTNQAVCGILPNNNILPEFIYYKFLEGKEKLVKQAVGGAQPNISQIKIKNTLIPIPPLETQQQIVLELDALQMETKKLEAIYQQKIVNLEEMKKSVLQKAFNGELIMDNDIIVIE